MGCMLMFWHRPCSIPQQLAKIKESLTNELSQYARSGNQLMLAANKFEESRQAIAELAQNKEGACKEHSMAGEAARAMHAWRSCTLHMCTPCPGRLPTACAC